MTELTGVDRTQTNARPASPATPLRWPTCYFSCCVVLPFPHARLRAPHDRPPRHARDASGSRTSRPPRVEGEGKGGWNGRAACEKRHAPRLSRCSSPRPIRLPTHSLPPHPPQVVAKDYPRPNIDSSPPFQEAAALSTELASFAKPAKPLKVVIAGAGAYGYGAARGG